MLKFILNTLIMFSMAAIIYLVAKTLPRITDGETTDKPLKAHWVTVYLEKTDVWLKARFEKILRRLKVWILKLDNWVSGKLNKFKKVEPKETIVTLEGEGSEKNQNQV